AVGDGRRYFAPILSLATNETRRWAAERAIEGDLAALSHDPRVVELVQGIVDGVNRDRSRFEQVKRFAILPRDFTIDAGEVTQTLKLRRRVVAEHFQAETEELYACRRR